MDQQYQNYHKFAENLRYKFHDVRDLPDHPTTQFITRQIDQLRADIDSGKAPRAIESRARGIQQQIMQAERSGQRIISPDHSNMFHHELEHFISNDLRKHPHYN